MGNAIENSGGSSKFPGGYKVIHRSAQTAFVRAVTPRYIRLHNSAEVIKACLQGVSRG